MTIEEVKLRYAHIPGPTEIPIDLLEPLTPLEKLAEAKLAIKARYAKKEEKETKAMYTPEQVKTQYLLSEANTLFNNKETGFRETFHLDAVKPMDQAEQVAFIKANKFTWEEGTDLYTGRKFKRIIWRDPATPPDRAGYDAAYNAMKLDFNQLVRVINIKDPNIALDALVAFEQKTYH